MAVAVGIDPGGHGDVVPHGEFVVAPVVEVVDAMVPIVGVDRQISGAGVAAFQEAGAAAHIQLHLVGTGTIAVFRAAPLKAAFVGEEQAHGHGAGGVALIRRRRPQVPTQHQAIAAGHRLGLSRSATGRQQFGREAERLGVGFAQPGFVGLAVFWRGGGLVAGPVHRDLQPGGCRDEQAQDQRSR